MKPVAALKKREAVSVKIANYSENSIWIKTFSASSKAENRPYKKGSPRTAWC